MKLDGGLNQSWSSGADYSAKVGVVDFSVNRGRAVKLGVVEHVERLNANVEGFGFCDGNRLAELQVEVLDAWAVERAARGVAQLAQRLRREEVDIEFGLAIAR